MPIYSVEKSIQIDASPEDVFAKVRDFKSWPEWSPWLIAEPDCSLSFADDGKAYSWEGKVTGVGDMAVLDEQSPGRIDYKLNFLKPMKAHSDVSFTFVSEGGGTKATWTMEGKLPFFLFFLKGIITSSVGMDYERGLLMLKDMVESGSMPSKLEFPGVTDWAGCRYVGVRSECAIAEVKESMKAAMGKLHDLIVEGTIEPAGKPLAVYHQWQPGKGRMEYTLGFPVAATVVNLPAEFVEQELPACQAYQIVHTGPYRHLGNAWASGMMHGRSKVFAQSKRATPFEVYENSPEEVAENDLVTTVYLPAKSG